MRIKRIWFLTLLISIVVVVEGLSLLYKPKLTIDKDYLLLEPPAKLEFPTEVVTEAMTILSGDSLCGVGQECSTTTLAKLELELLGTAIGNIKDPIAFIKDLKTGKQGIYRRGDIIRDAKLMSIAMGEVVFDRDGHREVLRLSERARAWAKIDEGSSPIMTVSGEKIVVNRSSALKQAPRIYNTLRSVKVKPYYQSDKVVGLMIEGIAEGSLIEQAGVRNRDIIKTVNNQKVDSYQKALQIFSKVRNQKEISLDLVRDGESKTLSYRIDL